MLTLKSEEDIKHTCYLLEIEKKATALRPIQGLNARPRKPDGE